MVRNETRRTIEAGVHGVSVEYLRDCSDRLGIVSLGWGGVWLLVAVRQNLLPSGSPAVVAQSGPWPWPGNIIAGTVILASFALWAYTRHTRCDTKRSLDLGLLYEVFLALCIALVSHWTPQATGPTWVAFLVLVHPAIVPNTFRATLAVGLIAASMDPLGMAVTTLRGVPIPPFDSMVWMFVPTYAAAILAVLLAHLMRRLGREVTAARLLGSYELGDRIGTGGMGEVFRARHRLLKRPAAAKLTRLNQVGASDGLGRRELVERFWKEAEAAASLSSPHAVALYDFGLSRDSTFYYVMELLHGLDLDALVERFGPVPPARAVHLLRQACEALAEAHAIGLVHRDIKPANLFAARVGVETDFIKVLDFGLVKSVDEDRNVSTTVPGRAMGTPAYMAPEIASGQRLIDHRADIYSLGCVAYWLLTGSLVFEAETPMKMLIAHVEHDPVPPSHRSEQEIPARLDQVVLSCLAKDPELRPSGAAEFAQRLIDCDVGNWTRDSALQWWQDHLPDLAQSPSDHLGATWSTAPTKIVIPS
jgi:eukaryotic-like serine/threonine-protein kinase